ncbi:linear amide C-N hydrolase [Ferrimonas balearica]|uniref:linear amide C-N hydrolase n=1 Tax=Ferrimonas balearica TaxID=44012 RepID=UPI001F179717|nr:linear amide C-N hydrolase [Ferrimonas balearica]MBY6016856.1 linear amide C-N hydrolase [Halomonas denitrificans]MBY6093123.1 linear amide C-N hydrolase [Ferrimonas balearica]
MCTRIVYETESGKFITGRGMDWNDPTSRFDVFVLPRGLNQVGGQMDNPLKWTSKYASVFTGMYGSVSSDGMNEKGLAVNALYFAEADYGDHTQSEKPKLSVGAWNQYFLDNFASVKEAVAAMQGELPFVIVAPLLANGRPATGHLSLSDESGDSAILEYIGGELVIHHGSEYAVMTNSPTYEEQIAINTYWKLIGGNRALPGTINAADRFVRTSYFLESTPKFPDGEEAVAAAMSIMRSIGVPLGMADPDHPNISATLWRTLADHSNKRYYFESALQPALFWVDFESLNIEAGAPILSAQVNGPVALFGNINDKLQVADLIAWM